MCIHFEKTCSSVTFGEPQKMQFLMERGKGGRMKNLKPSDKLPKAEVERRFTAGLSRALSTPHKPHKPLRAKKKAKKK